MGIFLEQTASVKNMHPELASCEAASKQETELLFTFQPNEKTPVHTPYYILMLHILKILSFQCNLDLWEIVFLTLLTSIFDN